MMPDDKDPWLALASDEIGALSSVLIAIGQETPDLKAHLADACDRLRLALGRYDRATWREDKHLTDSGCKHPDWRADVSVGRMVAEGAEDDLDAELTGLMVELRVRCVYCDAPARFRCPVVGLSWGTPAVSPDLAEIRLPVFTDARPELGEGLVGFTVQATYDPDRTN